MYFFKRPILKLFPLYFLVILSHTVLDFFGTDTNPPNGMMIFWPFSTEFYSCPISVFPSVDSSKEGIFLLVDMGREIIVELVLVGGAFLLILRSNGSK